jgi:hypothetical protein
MRPGHSESLVDLLYWYTRTNTDAEGAPEDARKLAEVVPVKFQKLFGLLGGMEGKAAASAAQGDKLWPLLGEQFTCVTGTHVQILTQKALRLTRCEAMLDGVLGEQFTARRLKETILLALLVHKYKY